jgi:putative flippase GtrA
VSCPLRAAGNSLFQRSVSLRFIVVGTGNTLFSSSLLMLFLWLDLGVVIGSALALASGILFSFYTQGTVVFRHKSWRAFSRFVIAWAIIYLINLAEIRTLAEAGFNTYLSGLIATIPTTIIAFFVQKLLVFRGPQPQNVAT